MASLHVARAESLQALRHVSMCDTQSTCFSASKTNEDTKNAVCLLFYNVNMQHILYSHV